MIISSANSLDFVILLCWALITFDVTPALLVTFLASSDADWISSFDLGPSFVCPAIKDIISTYADNMEVLKKEFIRINENFQSGKDAVAGELLNHSIGRLHIMLSSFVSIKGRFPEYNLDSIEIEGETLGDTIDKLNTLLSQVVKSLEINDIVMAGDLLEYELPDILEKFVPYLRRIKEILV